MNNFVIDSLIEQLALQNRIKSFYPSYVCKAVNLPLNEVLEKLNFLTEGGYIELQFEIRCDNLDILGNVENYSECIGKKIYCINCGQEVEITLNNIFPIYYISDSYRNYVKKNLKIQRSVI